MIDLEQWWRARNPEQRRVLLTLRGGQDVPPSVAGPVGAPGPANSATGRPGEAAVGAPDWVSGTVVDYLDRKRGECAVLDCPQPATRIVEESGQELRLHDQAGGNSLLSVDPPVMVCSPVCDEHDFGDAAL
jgi:hypothetical protein